MQEDGCEKITIKKSKVFFFYNLESLRLSASFFVKIIFHKENVSLDAI